MRPVQTWSILPLGFVWLLAGLSFSLLLGQGSPPDKPSEDPHLLPGIDVFMERVLKKRTVNWDDLKNYVFSEEEVLEVKGFEAAVQQSFRHEYVWYERDGELIRSPVRVNGRRLSEKEQKAGEKRWNGKGKGSTSGRRIIPSYSLRRDDFFNFEFEPGNYYFAGRRHFEGRDVVVVEYYPPNPVDSKEDDDGDDEDDKPEEESGESFRGSEMSPELKLKFHKTTLVTLLVEPGEHQIVQITFSNVGLEFLPLRWLFRLDQIRASMTIDKPLGNVWLPRRLSASGRVTAAPGTVAARYSRRFYDYKKTDVTVDLKFIRNDNSKKP